MRKNFRQPHRDDKDLDKEFPDPVLTERDYQSIQAEIEEIRRNLPKGNHPPIRQMWIVKNKGGIIRSGSLSIYPLAYRRLANRWDQFTTLSARKEFAEGRRFEQYEAFNKELINKLRN